MERSDFLDTASLDTASLDTASLDTASLDTASLDTASTIGRRISRRALWDGNLCTWEIAVPDMDSRQRQSKPQRAGGTLYQGSAGIAWFLAELYAVTGDDEVGRAARGGLEYALTEGEKLAMTSFGFHGGRLGIAWTAARLAEIFEHQDYAESAWRLLKPLAGQEHHDQGLDVIAGAGGAIPALLQLASSSGKNEWLEMAIHLGDQLINRAHREPWGWAWSTGGSSAVRCLNGLAHGASGMGLALLELARASGDGRYRFGAEMAFLYERRFYSESDSNWPDLRHQEIANYISGNRLEELRQAALDNALPPYSPTYMTAWCHGSPGIGLARLRALEITGQQVYRQEAEAALRSALPTIEGQRLEEDNFSLCHGVAGNCLLPLLGAEILGRPELAEAVERAAIHGIETYESAGKSWPCGTLGRSSDPSLLVGEAGIGAFYLGLANPATPSILLLRPTTTVATTTVATTTVATTTVAHSASAIDPTGYETAARECVEESFGETWRVFQRLAPAGLEMPHIRPGQAPLEQTPTELAHSMLTKFVEQREEAQQPLFEDAFLTQRTRHELALELADHTEAFLRTLTRPNWEDVDTQRALLTLSPRVRFLENNYDWPAWLETPGTEEPPAEEPCFHICYVDGNVARCLRLGPLVALILDLARDPTTLDEATRQVTAAFGDPESIDLAAVKQQVHSQIEQLYLAGFVDLRQM